MTLTLRNQLFLEYMPLVRTSARRYCIPTVSIADLEQEGAIALILALDRYRPSSSVPFEAYALPLIKKALLEAIAYYGHPTTVPRNRAGDFVLEPIRLDTPVSADDDEPLTLADCLPDESASVEEQLTFLRLHQSLEEQIPRLRPRQQQVLSLVYAWHSDTALNCSQIAQQLHLSPVYVRQTLSDAIRSLRRKLTQSTK